MEKSYGQGTLTTGRRQYGRGVSRRSTKYARLLTNAAVQRNVYGLDNFTSFGDSSGSLFLINWLDAGVGRYRVPVHLWDVTSAPNNVAGVYTAAQTGYAPTFDAVNPALLEWRTIGNPNGFRNTGTSSTASCPNASSLLRGVKAKFMFYCGQTIPSKITVALVQIMDDKFHPPKNPAGASLDVGGSSAFDTPLGSTTDVATISFWEAVAQKVSKNPVCQQDGNALRNMKVLRSHTFTLNPKETSDKTQTTYHQFDFYHKFNRRCRYNWQDQDTVNLQLDNDAPVNQAVNKCSVEPKARLYLLVTGTSEYESEAENKNKWPSYDVTMRFYHDDMGA